MKQISLNGIWQLRGRRQGAESEKFISLDAKVPGCVQLDLSEAGYLPRDLFMGENILEAEKYEDHEWFYERKFAAPCERDNVYLVFEWEVDGERGINHYLCGNPPVSLEKYAEIMEKYGLWR